MAVILLALGSRGDVQPMAVLAGELTRRGQAARVVATSDFAGLAAGCGADFVSIAADSREAVAMTHARFGRQLFSHPLGQAWLLRRWLALIAEPVADACLESIGPGDVVLSGILTRGVGLALAEARGARLVTVLHTGQVPTRYAESHFAFDHFRGRAAYDLRGARLSWRIASGLGAPAADLARAKLGLPRLAAGATAGAADAFPVIVAASPLVVPPAHDWPKNVVSTGYPTPRQESFAPDAELAAFLDAGPEPVYVGFSSLGASGAHDNLAPVIEAARLSGRRIVTPAVGGAAAGSIDRRVHVIDSVPHDWLLPRMAAVIHHGGAGTTWAGLLSGRPSVAVPFGVDQPYHAHRLHGLGVGPEPIPVQRLSGTSLARLIAQATSGSYDERAAEVGRVARAEDGTEATIAALTRWGYL